MRPLGTPGAMPGLFSIRSGLVVQRNRKISMTASVETIAVFHMVPSSTHRARDTPITALTAPIKLPRRFRSAT
ncbi:hypothetical protein [Burkholderia diffusa]|uniref:hypothetical protein n=1 Tax=Burkholderia diffusa TaxID=488732 RepID=UPI000A452886|nr:hypothetical protein [Burkholderia diffusa]